MVKKLTTFLNRLLLAGVVGHAVVFGWDGLDFPGMAVEPESDRSQPMYLATEPDLAQLRYGELSRSCRGGGLSPVAAPLARGASLLMKSFAYAGGFRLPFPVQNLQRLEPSVGSKNLQLAVPPIIRTFPFCVTIPDDLKIERQTPLSSGRQEILWVSPSTGMQQTYQVNLPGASSFTLYEAEFKNVSGLIGEFMPNSDNADNTSPAPRALNRNFSLTFSRNRLSRLVLADGSYAEFVANSVTIFSPQGTELETIPLSQAERPSSVSVAPFSLTKDLESNETYSSQQLSQANAVCQQKTKGTVRDVAEDMRRKGDAISANSSSPRSRVLGGTLSFGAEAIEENLAKQSENLPKVICKQPIRCGQQRVSGESETRTDLFQIDRRASQQVTLEYDFFKIPDRLEIWYDGERVDEVGFTSGSGVHTISLPGNSDYVGVKLIGNSNPETLWWYTISCAFPNTP